MKPVEHRRQIRASDKKTAAIIIIMSLLGTTPSRAQAEFSCLQTPLRTACETASLSLYVGPQSVAPGETLHIAVEAQTARGGASDARVVIIIDEDSGQTYRAPVYRGLAHLDIPAPRRAGRISFRAEVEGLPTHPVSNVAEVLIHPGQPTAFDLFVEKDRGRLFVFSSLITDRFGNLIDDGMVAELSLMRGGEAFASQTVRIEQGRIGVFLDCDRFAEANAGVRVRVGGQVQWLAIPDFMCARAA